MYYVVMNIDTNKVNIIISADDYGRKHDANLAIRDCFKSGLINHASIMMINDATEEAVKMIDNIDQIGLHFNVLEGYPLTKDIELNVNFKHSLAKAFNSKRTLFFLLPHEKRFIRNELIAQIEKYLSYGFKPTTFDSHGHTHTRYPVAKLITPILKKYGFEYVRIPFSLKQTHIRYKQIVTNIFRKNFKTVDYFVDGYDFINMDLSKYIGFTIEVMTHPYYENGVMINRREKVSLEQIQEHIDKIDV